MRGIISQNFFILSQLVSELSLIKILEFVANRESIKIWNLSQVSLMRLILVSNESFWAAESIYELQKATTVIYQG